MSNWFRIENKNNQNDIFIFEEIGCRNTNAKELINKLDKLNKNQPLFLHINSPGGSYFDAVSLLSYLKSWKGKLTAYLEGLAASAASYLLTGMNRVIAYPQSLVMIHDVQTNAYGNAKEFRQLADNLEKVSIGLVEAYKRKTGQSEEVVRNWLSKDSWFTAQEAKDIGLVDEIISGKEISTRT